MHRPRIKISRDNGDWFLETIGLSLIALMMGFPLYYFSQLPDIIPTHFNAAGEPDGFNDKNTLWAIPALGIATYLGLLLLNNYPHSFNYLKEITPDNAERHYRMATKLVRTVNILIAATFFYITYGIIETALNKQEGLSTFFLSILLIAVISAIGVYAYSSIKSPK